MFDLVKKRTEMKDRSVPGTNLVISVSLEVFMDGDCSVLIGLDLGSWL
jgi:hypothetical protein